MNFMRTMVTLAACALPSCAALMDGVTLVYSTNSTKLYSGTAVSGTALKSWSVGGYAVQFTEDGSLYYEGSGSGTCAVGTKYGSIGVVKANGSTSTILSNATGNGGLHHSFTVTSKGTILAILGEYRTGTTECSEKIVEVDPTTNQIIWTWHAQDHYTTTQSVASKIYTGLWNSGSSDPLHFNSVSYDPTRDVIVVSAHALQEVFLIDRSLDSTAAKGATGGNYGKGGDLLFRFGKPANYGATGTAYISTATHGANIVPPGYPGAGNILLVANVSPVYGGKATGFEVVPVESGTSFTQTTAGFSFSLRLAVAATGATSNFGGIQRLYNGNTVVTHPGLSIANEYDVPASDASATSLQSYAVSGSQYGIRRYPLCNAGLSALGLSVYNSAAAGCDMSGSSSATTISSSVTPSSSSSSSATSANLQAGVMSSLQVVVSKSFIQVQGAPAGALVRVLDVVGQLCYEATLDGALHLIGTTSWTQGVYLLQIRTNKANWSRAIHLQK